MIDTSNPFKIEAPGVLRLVGTAITITQKGAASLVVSDGTNAGLACGDLPTAKRLAFKMAADRMEMGLGP